MPHAGVWMNRIAAYTLHPSSFSAGCFVLFFCNSSILTFCQSCRPYRSSNISFSFSSSFLLLKNTTQIRIKYNQTFVKWSMKKAKNQLVVTHIANKTIDSKTHLQTACVKTEQKEFELKRKWRKKKFTHTHVYAYL